MAHSPNKKTIHSHKIKPKACWETFTNARTFQQETEKVIALKPASTNFRHNHCDNPRRMRQNLSPFNFYFFGRCVFPRSLSLCLVISAFSNDTTPVKQNVWMRVCFHCKMKYIRHVWSKLLSANSEVVIKIKRKTRTNKMKYWSILQEFQSYPFVSGSLA